MFPGLTCFFFVSQPHTNHSTHGSLHSLDVDVGGSMDPYKENLRRVQSTDSLGSSLSSQQGLGGHNHKAKSASHLDESDFGPLVGADCGVTDTSFGETSSISSIKLTGSHFLLTKDQEKAIKAMTPEQEETASLLSSISHTTNTAYLPPVGYRLVSDSEWNLLQQEVNTECPGLNQIKPDFFGIVSPFFCWSVVILGAVPLLTSRVFNSLHVLK